MCSMLARLATLRDCAAIALIYNEGIEDRIATFETQPRSSEDVRAWFDGIHPLVVIEAAGQVVAFAATFGYRPRQCYAGIAEVSVYVSRSGRRRGAGRADLEALILEAEKRGFWKLVSRIFPENIDSRKLVESVGFREAGIYRKHGKLDGEWRDVVIVERLIAVNLT